MDRLKLYSSKSNTAAAGIGGQLAPRIFMTFQHERLSVISRVKWLLDILAQTLFIYLY